jgi:hypothetical protein
MLVLKGRIIVLYEKLRIRTCVRQPADMSPTSYQLIHPAM